VKRNLSLRELRERTEKGEVIGRYEWGGCDCFIPPDEEDKIEGESE